MKRSRSLRWLVIASLLFCLAAGSAFGGYPAARAAGRPAVTEPAIASGLSGEILGISAVSPTDVWAVGTTHYYYMLLAHWNGKRWSEDTSLAKTKGDITAISMISATDGWAIGGLAASFKMLVLHWNGKTWSRDASAPSAEIDGASLATVGGDVWIGGTIGNKGAPVTLHRTGGRWYVVPVSGNYAITALGAASRTNIWGAGDILTRGKNYSPTMLHWNGSVWKTVAFPRWASRLTMVVTAMAPGSKGAMLAVGDSETLSNVPLLAMRWNGKTWARSAVAIAGILGNTTLTSIASAPGGTAWGVGVTASGAVIAHWNGTSWKAWRYVPMKMGGNLFAVSAPSPNDAWVAGYECTETGIACNRGFTEGFVLHWNGRTWS